MADGPEEHLGLDLLQDLHSKLLHDWFCCRKENIMVYSHAKSTACIHALLSCRCKRRIGPKDLIRPVGCRSCTPRPRCALSCARVMRRAIIKSVNTMPLPALQPCNLSNVVSLDTNSFRCHDHHSHEHLSRFTLRQDKQQAERILSKFLSACKKKFCRFV